MSEEKKKLTVYIEKDQMDLTEEELNRIMGEEGESDFYEMDEVDVVLPEVEK